MVRAAPSFQRTEGRATLATAMLRRQLAGPPNLSFTTYWSAPRDVWRRPDGALTPVLGGAHDLLYFEANLVPASDHLVDLLDMDTQWRKSVGKTGVPEGRVRNSGTLQWTGTAADLVFGSNAQLRALAEVYASGDEPARFVQHFVDAWVKVTTLGRFAWLEWRAPS